MFYVYNGRTFTLDLEIRVPSLGNGHATPTEEVRELLSPYPVLRGIDVENRVSLGLGG